MKLDLTREEALRIRFTLLQDRDWRTHSPHKEQFSREIGLNVRLLNRISDLLDAEHAE
jgi:hypothetical protein